MALIAELWLAGSFRGDRVGGVAVGALLAGGGSTSGKEDEENTVAQWLGSHPPKPLRRCGPWLYLCILLFLLLVFRSDLGACVFHMSARGFSNVSYGPNSCGALWLHGCNEPIERGWLADRLLKKAVSPFAVRFRFAAGGLVGAASILFLNFLPKQYSGDSSLNTFGVFVRHIKRKLLDSSAKFGAP